MIRRNYKVLLIGISTSCFLVYTGITFIRRTGPSPRTESESERVSEGGQLPTHLLPLHHSQGLEQILDHVQSQRSPSGGKEENPNPKDESLGLLYRYGEGVRAKDEYNPRHFFRPDESKSKSRGRHDGGSGSGSSLLKLKIPYKLVHIDLKGGAPKMSYLKDFLRTVRESGGNGILLEYEDMFPFRDALNGTAHKFHYTDEEIRSLIAVAKENDLEIIPLVQTFGHLEFVLKLDKFSHLRELNEFPQEICPSNDIAWHMVKTIIDQVMDFHAPSRYSYLHIGCDEVFHIGECSRCKGKDVKDLFLNHVLRVARYVKTKYGVTPIIWDDMLRKFYAEDLLKSGIGGEVEVMMWDYTEDVDRLLSPYLWPMYTQVFPHIWVASAFKGAFGETLYKVNIQRHAINHLSWLRVLSREEGRIRNLRGIALTGWSRYDHFSVLCELLPMAVPSMILQLQILVHQDLDAATKQLFKQLKCDGGSVERLEECEWNGVELYTTVSSLQFYQEQCDSLISMHRKDKGWLSPYALHHNYSSPWRLLDPIQSATQYLMSLNTYTSNVQTVLRKFFQEDVVEEWIEQKIQPLVHQLNSLLKDATSLTRRTSWPRRPPP